MRLGLAGGRPSRREAARAAPSFRLGEDVVHAAFGEGVVTGVEPGGIVVVRFAGDGSERKLMAEYAPIIAADARADAGRITRRRNARHDHRRQGGRRARCARRSRGTSRRSPRATAARPAWRRSSSATTRPSAVYVGGKQRACAEVGIAGFDHRLPADASREQVAELIEQLNADPAVSGILLQLPVPDHLDGAS